MLELTIRENVYQFNFGMGFLRDINKKYQKPVDGVPDAKENVGLNMMVAGLRVKDCEYLAEVLESANKAQNPRVTRQLIDAYIDDPDTDIDQLFDTVMDFLKTSNATKNVVNQFLQNLDEYEAEQKAKQKAEK